MLQWNIDMKLWSVELFDFHWPLLTWEIISSIWSLSKFNFLLLYDYQQIWDHHLISMNHTKYYWRPYSHVHYSAEVLISRKWYKLEVYTVFRKKHPLTLSFISPWVMCRFKQKLQWIYLRNSRFWQCRN